MSRCEFTDYESFKSDSQDILQQELLNFLYSESSWKYKVLRDSNISRDKYQFEPQQDDVVAIKLGGGSDLKMEVVISTSQCPRIIVRMVLYGKKETPLVHSCNLINHLLNGALIYWTRIMHEKKLLMKWKTSGVTCQ